MGVPGECEHNRADVDDNGVVPVGEHTGDGHDDRLVRCFDGVCVHIDGDWRRGVVAMNAVDQRVVCPDCDSKMTQRTALRREDHETIHELRVCFECYTEFIGEYNFSEKRIKDDKYEWH
jgi:hypothetical protein